MYLIRSLGTVYGVAVTSAILQTTLSIRLPDALGEIPDKWRVRPCPRDDLRWVCGAGIARDAYCWVVSRLSTRSVTRFQPSKHCRRTFSSRLVMCTTTGFDIRLPRRHLSQQPPSARLCWPRHPGSGAQSSRLQGLDTMYVCTMQVRTGAVQVSASSWGVGAKGGSSLANDRGGVTAGAAKWQSLSFFFFF